MKNQWYKEMAVYQIWPRSFCDGNADGIGDLEGVLSRLDYLKELGIDCIWFSPLYVSPNADFGYDIADYKDISPDYGDLELFKKVLDESHKRGMKVIMDLVVNHTSDEHEWFKKSKDKNSPYHDYYFWKKGRKKRPPNNWLSVFEGGAWEYDKDLDEYYLHIFAKKQPDLNMTNPVVRNEVKDIMRFWLDMGIDGFREDVITFISKPDGLPNGLPLPAARGFELYMNGPNIHEYLTEFKTEVLDHYDCFVVGEAPMMNVKTALKYVTEGPNQELDMMFHFEHMSADCFLLEILQTPFNLRRMKRAFSRWQTGLAGKSWNALYIENHDHPRIISRYGSEKYWKESGKMLANMYILQSGTPYIYQGQEIGMTNISLETLDEYVDVFAHNNYKMLRRIGVPEKLVMDRVRKSSRDNARTPVQWSGHKNAGFTAGTPWFNINPNYKDINVEDQLGDEDSILNHYKALLKFRKENSIVIYGDYKEYYKNNRKLFVYARSYEGKRLLVVNSFSDKAVRFKAPDSFDLSKGTPVLCNYKDNSVKDNGFVTRPYETRAYLFSENK